MRRLPSPRAAATLLLPTACSLALLLLYFLVAWQLLGDAMLYDGAGFALLLLYLTSSLAATLLRLAAPRLPPLLGMLLAGLALRTLPSSPLLASTPLLGHPFPWWSSTTRAIALAVIMARAGLAIDLPKLRAIGGAAARLASLPCLGEAAAAALLARPLLGLPAAWGGTLGFVLAAVSPAVVVPGMLDLQHRRIGTDKGIPTLVLAAASIDDVLAIAGFSVCLSLAAAGEEPEDGSGGAEDGAALAWLALRAPTELAAGCATGVALGFGVAAPCFQHALSDRQRSLAIVGAALFTVLGGKTVAFSGGGALGAVVLGCTASRLWPAELRLPVQAQINALWQRLMPALFGLLGAAVDLHSIEPSDLGSGVLLILCALAVRLLITRLAVGGAGLTSREAAFLCVAWVPKATVQAAVGGAALDLMRERALGAEAEARGALVLMLSVVVILLTAPVGATGIALAGPAWLSHDAREASGAAGASTREAERGGAARRDEAAGDRPAPTPGEGRGGEAFRKDGYAEAQGAYDWTHREAI
ncbi:hypothetical protein AB1Y20_012084 [Prymnesium parvum]|uniref:Cation/H+ exchanger domain-containing protein n=1 Tax=Prymnesium parvum TaxID=97485 RepID=A0AB34IN47_PRYPA